MLINNTIIILYRVLYLYIYIFIYTQYFHKKILIMEYTLEKNCNLMLYLVLEVVSICNLVNIYTIRLNLI